MNNQEVKQTENKAFIVGVLKKKEIEFKPTKTTGKLRASGYLTLVIDTTVGKGEVKVRVDQYAEKKDGGANSLYKALQTVAQQYKSIEEVGENGVADTIKIEGSLNDETYYSTKKEEFVEKLELKALFINRVDASTPHCCKVVFEGRISNITPIGSELEVETIGIGYEGVAVPIKAIIPQHLVAAFQGRYNVGCTTTLNIAIINEVTTKVLQEEVGFGEGIGEVIETYTTKRTIFGGGTPKFEGVPGAISLETTKQGIAIREQKLQEKKDNAIKNSQGGATMDAGFGGVNPGGFNTGAGMMPGGFNTGMGMPGGFGSFPQGTPGFAN